MPETPPKVLLDAQTDQALAGARELRASLNGQQGEIVRMCAEGMASHLAAQFPGQPIGRVVMAATQALKSIERVLTEHGHHVSVDLLVIVAALVADELNSEATA
jgi:hypothetical protein